MSFFQKKIKIVPQSQDIIMKRPNINMGSTKSRYFSDVELQQISLTTPIVKLTLDRIFVFLKSVLPHTGMPVWGRTLHRCGAHR